MPPVNLSLLVGKKEQIFVDWGLVSTGGSDGETERHGVEQGDTVGIERHLRVHTET